jgi:TPR repeat protein
MDEDSSSAEVLRLLRLAAEQNYEEAQNLLGALSEGQKQDSIEALRWFKLAAVQGLSGAL